MANPNIAVTFSGSGNQGAQIGYIAGNSTANIYPPAKKPETPPSPSSTVPFPRDLHFVDRATLLSQIKERCSFPASRTALVGLGGTGKSQLAIEYSYRIREESPETWVFWVHASNVARFEQSYWDIAEEVRLPGKNDPQVDIIKLVHTWLRSEKKKKWLLIFDNVDDARFLLETPANGQEINNVSNKFKQPIWTNLRPSHNGSILITTRTRDVAYKLVEERDMILVEPMNEEQALALFEMKLGRQSDKKDISELAAALEYMPLAIVQAAAYISHQVPRCTIRRYTEKFNKSDQKKTVLLDHEAGPQRRDGDAKRSITITWQISFDYICEIRQSAADLLSLMSFFDRQGIPEVLLRDQSENECGQVNKRGKGSSNECEKSDSGDSKENDEWDTEKSDDEEDASDWKDDEEFENDVLMLRNYSFVSVNTDGNMFMMHGLVQLATRDWLKTHGKFERWKQQCIKNLYSELPKEEHNNSAKCKVLFPNIRTVLRYRPNYSLTCCCSLLQWASILQMAAWYDMKRGNISDAETMAMKAMKTTKELLGKENSLTLTIMATVAMIYMEGGRLKEAEDLQVQVVERCLKMWKREDPRTLNNMHNLALIYKSQRRWNEAERISVQIIEIEKKVLGQEHPDRLTSMANLASTYQDQERWKDAEDLHLQVLKIRKRILGQEHAHTLVSLGNLASNYQHQERWKEAEDLQLQVMEVEKRLFGPEHLSTLITMDNLASTYHNQGRCKEAEDLQVQVVEASLKILGQGHSETLACIHNLISTYENQGRWKEAEDLYRQVLAIQKNVLGMEHPSTLTSMRDLALNLKQQNCIEAAEMLLTECVPLHWKVLGPTHPNTVSLFDIMEEWMEGCGKCCGECNTE